jgi:hypothetical protein
MWNGMRMTAILAAFLAGTAGIAFAGSSAVGAGGAAGGGGTGAALGTGGSAARATPMHHGMNHRHHGHDRAERR